MSIFSDTFKDLPDELPYGFWIAPDGSFKIVPFWGHTTEIQKVLPDITLKNCVDLPQEKGFIMINTGKDVRVDMKTYKVLFQGDVTGLKFSHHQTTNRALKTLKDLGAFYKVPLFQCKFHN